MLDFLANKVPQKVNVIIVSQLRIPSAKFIIIFFFKIKNEEKKKIMCAKTFVCLCTGKGNVQ